MVLLALERLGCLLGGFVTRVAVVGEDLDLGHFLGHFNASHARTECGPARDAENLHDA